MIKPDDSKQHESMEIFADGHLSAQGRDSSNEHSVPYCEAVSRAWGRLKVRLVPKSSASKGWVDVLLKLPFSCRFLHERQLVSNIDFAIADLPRRQFQHAVCLQVDARHPERS
jgi:hypothetical protein